MEDMDMMMNQQNEQPEKCAKCEEFPEDILMLACNHDLCLICAANTFSSSENKFARQNNSIKCNLCGTQTQLDQSSIYELEKIAIAAKQQKSSFTVVEQQQINEQQQQQQQQEGLFSQNLNSQKPPLLINEPSIMQQNKLQSQTMQYSQQQPPQQQQASSQYYKVNSTKEFCSEHPDEYISYYCFDCNSKCICPECVIHGVHKGHEVQTIKKAHPLILQKVKETQNSLHDKIDEIKVYQEKFQMRQREQSEQFKQFKKQVIDTFEDLRKKIDMKEQEILSVQEQMEKEQNKNISFDYNLMNSKLESLATEIQSINQYISSKDEIQLLNYYSESSKLQELNKQKDQTLTKKLEQDLEECQHFFTKMNNIGSGGNSILAEIQNITQLISKSDFIQQPQQARSFNTQHYNGGIGDDSMKEITNNLQNLMNIKSNNENINAKSNSNNLINNNPNKQNAQQQLQQYKHQQQGSNNSLKNFELSKQQQNQISSQTMNFVKQI